MSEGRITPSKGSEGTRAEIVVMLRRVRFGVQVVCRGLAMV